MIQVYSKALKQSTSTERIIGHLQGKDPGPTLVFFAGIHGNEPAGVFALQQVFKELLEKQSLRKGNIYAIGGNMFALSRGVRYLNTDLNRMWTNTYLNGNNINPDQAPVEYNELAEIRRLLIEIIDSEPGPFYFFDLHTTSSDTQPFITINDTLLNRKFALNYQVPVVLGIEEYLEGPLLSHINTLGFISIGFESGQHDSATSIENHKAFVYQSLSIAGVTEVAHTNQLSETTEDHTTFYEIVFRHPIKSGDQFSMCHGFRNFQPITVGQYLANEGDRWLEAPMDGFIFMPLYQDQGDEGYFIIRLIPKKYLFLSKLLRYLHLDSMLAMLPGINWMDKERKTLRVNQHIARYFAKDFLHLMGYRVRQQDEFHLVARKREKRRERRLYKDEPWS